MMGAGTGYYTGHTVSGAGDINGDGLDDMLVGAYGYASNQGKVYVIWGGNSNTNLQLSDNLATRGITITGEPGSALGWNVNKAGDVDGDGKADFLIGASTYSSGRGRGYLFLGNDQYTNINLPNTAGQQVYTFTGININDHAGVAVNSAGDMNGDGKPDILVGAHDVLSATGQAYAIYGEPHFENTNLENLNNWGITFNGVNPSSFTGYGLASIGDVNGDGKDDILIGAPTHDSNRGQVYLIYGTDTPTPTSLPSTQPSAQPSSRPSLQPTAHPSSQPSEQPSGQPSRQPAALPSSQPSAQPSSRPSEQPSSQPSAQPSTQPSDQPSEQPSSQPSVQPSVQPFDQPSGQPSSQPSVQPSAQPSDQPSEQPSSQPSAQPSTQPSDQPSEQPSSQPSAQPSTQPSDQPSGQPSSQPSVQPSTQPSDQPSEQPSSQPSVQPSAQPSDQPSEQPSSQPSVQPSTQPSDQPSEQPSSQPSSEPSTQPSEQPSSQPSSEPSAQPSVQPSGQPSSEPSAQPSVQPSGQPSSEPSTQPSVQPSEQPSEQPSAQPSGQPSAQPSEQPSEQPSAQPSGQPSERPSEQPSTQPSGQPSAQPSERPSEQPSAQPTGQPSAQPSERPSEQPSTQPSGQPSAQPSERPSEQPSAQPSGQPSAQPSERPSEQPSAQPSDQPSAQPSERPSGQPSERPTMQHSEKPTTQPTAQPSGQPHVWPSTRPSIHPSSQPTGQPSNTPTLNPSSRPTDPKSSSKGNASFYIITGSCVGGALLLVAAGWCYRQRMLKHKAVKPLSINECALLLSQKPKKDLDLYKALEKFDCGYVRILSEDSHRGLYYVNRKKQLIQKFDIKHEDLAKLDLENVFSLQPTVLDKLMFATIFSTTSELCCGLLLTSSAVNEPALFKALDSYDSGFVRVQNTDDTGGLYFISAVLQIVIKFDIADELLTRLDKQQFFSLKHALLDHNQLTTLIEATNDEEVPLPVRTIQQTARIFHKHYLECFINEIFAEKNKRISAITTSSDVSTSSKDENLSLSAAYMVAPDYKKHDGNVHVFHKMSSYSQAKQPCKTTKISVAKLSKFEHVFRFPSDPAAAKFSASRPYSQKTQPYLKQTLTSNSTIFDTMTQKALTQSQKVSTSTSSQYNSFARQWVEDHMNRMIAQHCQDRMIAQHCQDIKAVLTEPNHSDLEVSFKHDISVRSFSPVENESNRLQPESPNNDIDQTNMLPILDSDLPLDQVNDSSSDDEEGSQEDVFKENREIGDLKALYAFNQTLRFFDRRATVYSRRLSTAPSPNSQSDIRQHLQDTRPTLVSSLESPFALNEHISANEAIVRPLQKQVRFGTEPLETILDIPARAGTAPAQKSRKEGQLREEHKELSSTSNAGKSNARRNSEHVSRIQPYLNKQSSNRFFEKRRSSQIVVHPTTDYVHKFENTTT